MSEKPRKAKKSPEPKKEDRAEAARRKKAEEEAAKAKLPKDIMNQRGYYDALINEMAEMRGNLEAIDKEMEEERAEKESIEQKIAAMQKWLLESEPAREQNRRGLEKLDSSLAELEDPTADKDALGRMLRFAGLPHDPRERADILRKQFQELVQHPKAAPAAPFSVTPRHGAGVEAVGTHDLKAEVGDVTVPVRCYSPHGRSFTASPAPPAIVFFHGGGFVLGSLDTHDWFCRSLSGLSGSTVVSVNYRQAPEHKSPAAFDDAYGALVWVAKGGLGKVPKRLGVAGDDAGGALAAACCLRAKDDPQGPQICVQLLLSPWLDLRPTADSMKNKYLPDSNKSGLDVWECNWYREVYAPEGSEALGGGPWTEGRLVSPLLAESVAGLPRAFIVYPVHSILAGEAIAYVERFRKEVGFEAVHTMRVEGPQHHFTAMSHDHQAQHVVSAAATFASALLWAP